MSTPTKDDALRAGDLVEVVGPTVEDHERAESTGLAIKDRGRIGQRGRVGGIDKDGDCWTDIGIFPRASLRRVEPELIPGTDDLDEPSDIETLRRERDEAREERDEAWNEFGNLCEDLQTAHVAADRAAAHATRRLNFVRRQRDEARDELARLRSRMDRAIEAFRKVIDGDES